MMSGGGGTMKNSNANRNASSRTVGQPRKRIAAAMMKSTNAIIHRHRRTSVVRTNTQAAPPTIRPSAREMAAARVDGAHCVVAAFQRNDVRYARMNGIRIMYENVSEVNAKCARSNSGFDFVCAFMPTLSAIFVKRCSGLDAVAFRSTTTGES